MCTAIFELNIVTDDPRLEGFAIEDWPSVLGRDSLDDDMNPAYEATGRNWNPTRLAAVWTPPKVTGEVQQYQDFPGVNMIYPAFSRRACDALCDMLEMNGEVLPLDADCGEYYFYNVTTVIDAIDFKNSEGDFFPDRPWLAISIDYFEFYRERLAGATIFRVPEWPIATLVSNRFVDRVHEHALNGFNFKKIWPYPKGVHWELEDKRLKTAAHEPGYGLKQQTVVIQLFFNGKKASTQEMKLIERLESEAKAQLMVTSVHSPVFGSYEGGEAKEGEYRMYFCCPDANRLVQKLAPWLRSIDWSGKVCITKRFGDLFDPDVPAESVEIR